MILITAGRTGDLEAGAEDMGMGYRKYGAQWNTPLLYGTWDPWVWPLCLISPLIVFFSSCLAKLHTTHVLLVELGCRKETNVSELRGGSLCKRTTRPGQACRVARRGSWPERWFIQALATGTLGGGGAIQ